MSSGDSKTTENAGSKILLEEYLAAEDDRLLSCLFSFQSAQFLGGFVNKWLVDNRPWAKEQIKGYVRSELNLPGHEVVFRRIFKHFHKAQDHEMMGLLMVALDRLVRRGRIVTYRYDWRTKRSWSIERLLAPANKSILPETDRYYESTWGKKTYRYKLPDRLNRKGNRLFSNLTRNYFRRSAWRYFRHLSYRDAQAYVVHIAKALAEYRDRDFMVGENIMDNWSLMHACYFHAPGISFTAAHTNLLEGHSLSELSAAPYQPNAWKSDVARQQLISLLVSAQSTLVRMWAIEMFLAHHKESLAEIDLVDVIQMLGNPDPNLQEFASRVFTDHPLVPTMSIDQWLTLLEKAHVSLLPQVCDIMKQHVTLDRIDNDQLIRLTNARQEPLSVMGFDFLQQRHQQKPLTNAELKGVANGKCRKHQFEIVSWVLEQMVVQGYQTDDVIDFFDSLFRPTRAAAMTWLTTEDCPGNNDPLLWSRLIETPFDDVKIHLVELLNRRHRNPGRESDQFAGIWVAVILGVHRGGRTKIKAIDQLAECIQKHPEQQEQLLPVLAIAVRSLRQPEMRQAMVALTRLVSGSAELREAVQGLIPELEFCVHGAEA